MRIDREKLAIFLIAAASLAGIVILAAALDGFTFASPYQLLKSGSGEVVDPSIREELMRLLVFLVVALLPLVTVMLILASRRRRRLLFLLVLGALLLFVISLSHPVELPPEEKMIVTLTPEVLHAALLTPQPTPAQLIVPDEVGVTPTLVWLLSLGLAGVLVGLAVLVWLAWRVFRRQASPLQAIVASAEMALQALEQGEDVQGTVLRCYQTMLAAAVQAKGVERPDYLTPAEFVQRLVQSGLPRGPVERLTHLFETVRYSPLPSTAAMEAEAVICLQDVVAVAKGDL